MRRKRKFDSYDSTEINRAISAWLRLPEEERLGCGKDRASELGLSQDAFYQRVRRIRISKGPRKWGRPLSAEANP